MGGRVGQIIFDVAIIAGGIVSLALLALAFLFEWSRPDGFFIALFEMGEIEPNLFRAACEFGLRGWYRSIATDLSRRSLQASAIGVGGYDRIPESALN
jgi:hypothetical protein